MEFKEGRRRYIQRAKRCCFTIERGRVKIGPVPCIQSLYQISQRNHGFCRSEGAVSGTVNEGATQQPAISIFMHNVAIGAFVLVCYQAVA